MSRIILLVFSLFTVTLANVVPFEAKNENLYQAEMLTRTTAACQNWYNKEGDPSELLAQTLKPPCKISDAFPPTLANGWTVDPGCDASKQPKTCDLHKGAHGCYRHAKGSSGPGAQACYDPQGYFISDPWKGAGTLDVETPLGGLFQAILHGIHDVIPYDDCCKKSVKQPESCNLYYEKRPPGECADDHTG